MYIKASPSDLLRGSSAAAVQSALLASSAATASAVQSSAAVVASGATIGMLSAQVTAPAPAPVPAPAPAPAPAPSSGANLGAIIGIAVGLLVLLAAATYCCYRRRLKLRNATKYSASVAIAPPSKETGELAIDIARGAETQARKDAGLASAALTSVPFQLAVRSSDKEALSVSSASIAAAPIAAIAMPQLLGGAATLTAAAAEILLPGLLSLAREFPLIGPCAGVLLQFYYTHQQVRHNEVVFAALKEQCDLGVGWIREMAPRLKSLDCALVEQALTRVVSAVRSATDLMASLNQRFAKANGSATIGFLVRAANILTNTALSARDAARLSAALSALREAVSYLLQAVPTITGIQVNAKVDLVGAAIDHVEADMQKLLTMMDAARRSSDQEAMRRAKLAEVHVIKSVQEVLIYRDRCVGAGGEGIVYEGKFDRKKVAIKVIKDKTGAPLSHHGKEAIENELMLMNAARCHSVLTVYGYIHDTFETLVVLELSIGSLYGILEDLPVFPTLPLALLVAWLMDVASAVQHLHEKRIRHKDIKAQNMLLFKASGSRLIAKLADFGLAKATLTAGTSNASGAGTALFSAPEYAIHEQPYTFACDVYSVGMTGIQLFSRHNPRPRRDKPLDAQIAEAIDAAMLDGCAHQNPAMSAQRGPASLHGRLSALLRSAVADDPSARPRASDLAAHAEALLRLLGGDPRDEAGSPDYPVVAEMERLAEETREARMASRPLVDRNSQNHTASTADEGMTGATTSSSVGGAGSKPAAALSAEDQACVASLSDWLAKGAGLPPRVAADYASQIYESGLEYQPKFIHDCVKADAGFLLKLGVSEAHNARIITALADT